MAARSTFAKWLQKKITSRSDWFFAYTPLGARYVGALPYPDERITVVMNSVDTAAIRAGLSRVRQSDIEHFRASWNLHGSIASFIGALDDSKRLPFLIEAIRVLNSQNIDASYVIAGEGVLLERLKAETADLQNVRFIGRADGDLKNLLLAASKLLLVPGRVGLVAVDSLAAGVPIATTRWPYHAPEFEYLMPDRTSIISSDSVHAYAAKVAEALTNDDYLHCLAQNSLEAGDALGVENMAKNYLAGLRGALSLREKS
ncbi:glycosyltransferase [Paenarthrobacter sp. 22069]|uniref:glycosyltransferase n=1 Tax=Paenarthrobacter sp. 22069 TaxID=3453864 RepID=UPI003F82AFF5